MFDLSGKVALITGVTGQDGAYLADFLLNKGYEVHGIKRRSSLFNTQRIDHLYQDPHEKNLRFVLHYGDLTDATNLIRIIQEVQPDEIYNLTAQSHAITGKVRCTETYSDSLQVRAGARPVRNEPSHQPIGGEDIHENIRGPKGLGGALVVVHILVVPGSDRPADDQPGRDRDDKFGQ